MTAVITECNGTFYQKHQGSHIQSNGNDNLKHSSILFVAAKIAAACAKALRKLEKVAVALKYLAISMLAQLTGIKIAPVSCANALSISILSATLPGRVTVLTGRGTNFVYFGTGSVQETDSQKVTAEGSWSHRKE